MKQIGLGDIISYILTPFRLLFGLKDDKIVENLPHKSCGCAKRREYLNKMVKIPLGKPVAMLYTDGRKLVKSQTAGKSGGN